MSAITTTNRDLVSDWSCPICKDEFEDQYEPTTHVSGKAHGFHQPCIKDWVIRNLHNPTCPNCRAPIDPTALFSRTEQIMIKLKSAVTNTAYAAGFVTLGLGLTIVATKILAMIPTVMITAIETTGLETGIIVSNKIIDTVAIGGIAQVGLAVATTRQRIDDLPTAVQRAIMISMIGTVIGGAGTAIAQITADTIGTTLVKGVVTGAIGAGIGIAETAIAVGIVGGLWTGILEIKEFDQINHKFIGYGMYAGSLIGIVAIPFISLEPTLTVCIVGSIVGGIATGIFTLIGR